MKNLKSSTHDQVFKFKGASKSTLCCAAPTFMLFHYSLFLKFVKNFEIPCQGNEFTLKVEFTL